jgi:hypothetical protein
MLIKTSWIFQDVLFWVYGGAKVQTLCRIFSFTNFTTCACTGITLKHNHLPINF